LRIGERMLSDIAGRTREASILYSMCASVGTWDEVIEVPSGMERGSAIVTAS